MANKMLKADREFVDKLRLEIKNLTRRIAAIDGLIEVYERTADVRVLPVNAESQNEFAPQ